MTAIIRKLRRKRKLSSELHSRWGDVSITYPNAGSWSQCEQLAVGPSDTMPGKPLDQCRHHGSLDSLNHQGQSSRNLSTLPLGPSKERTSSTDSAITIPTGHYDARLRGRSKKKPPPPGPKLGTKTSANIRDFSDDSLTDEEEGSISALSGPKGRYQRDVPRPNAQEGDAYSRASKSPPLSVTSRMRRCSLQSTTAEASPSMPTASSSKHTSYTSSVPSVPSEEPRLGPRPISHDMKHARRSKPAPVAEQELVPSYDELYG
ncbi:hypothetical protein BBP40_008091 [Aspergillus hancockii]|nr:hypothetical protein BBP40_008091 [Aspergillus hancockii]